jgi:hypothetical protein
MLASPAWKRRLCSPSDLFCILELQLLMDMMTRDDSILDTDTATPSRSGSQDSNRVAPTHHQEMLQTCLEQLVESRKRVGSLNGTLKLIQDRLNRLSIQMRLHAGIRTVAPSPPPLMGPRYQ